MLCPLSYGRVEFLSYALANLDACNYQPIGQVDHRLAQIGYDARGVHMTRFLGWRLSAVILIVIAINVRAGDAQAPPANACALVTPSELESVLGGTVALKPSSMGEVQLCRGETAAARVSIRLFKGTKESFDTAEQAGLDAIKKMGAQVDVKTSGGIMCTTAVPPDDKATIGFGTTCTVMSKAPTYAVVDVTAKSKKDMVPMEKLRALAEKMASRF